MADWDPMLSDYEDPYFNTYMQGVGRDLANGSGRVTKLFVDKFPVDIGQEGLYNLFSEFGRVLYATLKPSNRDDGKLSYGFVTMDSAVNAEHAITQMNGRPLRSGIPLIVRPALTDVQKRKREEKKLMEDGFLENLRRSRDDDMMSSVSTLARNDLRFEPRVLAAQAKALLERTGQAYDLDNYLNVGRGRMQDTARYRRVDMERPPNFGRGRAQSLKNSPYLHRLASDYPSAVFGGRGRGRGWNSDTYERPRPGPQFAQRPNVRPNFGRGSVPQFVQPRKPMTENLRICLQCGAEDSAYRCQACKSYYCSHECQRDDWTRHKEVCLDISVHTFNMKYGQENGMDQHKPIQNHHRHQDNNALGHNNREFGNSADYLSDREEGGMNSFSGRNVKQINRGYESEAGGGGSNLKKQNKSNNFNKAENRNGSNHFDANQTKESKGRFQERNGGKYEEDEHYGDKKQGKLFHNSATNKSGAFKGGDKDNHRDNIQETKVFRNSNDSSNNDKDSRPHKSQTQKYDFDNKKQPSSKFSKKDQLEQDKRDAKQKPSPGSASGFDFSCAKEMEIEKRKAPRKDLRNANCRSEESKDDTKVNANSVEDAGSGDASCDLIAQTMEVGAANQCYITHYENPSQFWIMLKAEMIDFLAVSEEFKNQLTKMPKGLVKRVKAGDLYCLIDDGFWARVKIVTVGEGGNLTAFFPDVGKQGAIHISDLFYLDDTMRIFPTQAICCCIGNAKPMGRMWSEKAKSAVEGWLGEPYVEEFLFKVLQKRGNTHALEIIHGKENLAEFLISEGLAEAADINANLPRLTKEASEKGPVSAPTMKSRFMAKDLKGLAAVLKENDHISVNVMDVKSLTHYIGQVVNSNSTAALKEIEDIMKGLDLDRGKPYCPIQGECVLAKYSEDNRWYRSKVSRIDGDKFEVVFLDYGNIDVLKAKDTRKLEDRRLTTFPALALDLQLWGVDPEAAQEKMDLIDFDVLSSDFGLQELSSVVVKGKKGSTILVDFISKDKKQSLSKHLNKLSTTEAATPVSKDALPRNGNSDVVIVFINSCSSFYVAHSSNLKHLDTLLLEFKNKVKSLHECDNPAVGDLVVADFEGGWFRGEIKKVMKNAKKCEVFYLDYGNCAEVVMEKLYLLPQWASSHPAFAIHCSFDVDSVNLSPDADSDFKTLEGQMANVSLVRKEEGEDKCIVKMLTADGSDLLQLMTVDLETEKMSPAKSPSSTTSHQPSQAAKSTIKQELLPVSEEPVVSLVTHAQSMCEFYIQGISSDIEKLSDVMIELAATASDLPRVRDAQVGSQCTAQFEEDGMWYRAQITSSIENSEICTVKFIDYGNSQETLKQELRELPESTKSLCALAVPCCFKDFEKYLGQAQEQDLTLIHRGIDFARMKADVSSAPVQTTVHSHKSGVCIVTLNDSDGNNVLDQYKMETHGSSTARSEPLDTEASSLCVSIPAANLTDIPVTKMTDNSFQIVCTNMESITEFCCQRKEECVAKAHEISVKLQKYLANASPGKCKPVEGGVYGCLFDNDWYRCVVEEISGNCLSIRYIDWGNKEIRDVADLRPLQPEHLSFPITLMKCHLHGVTLGDDNNEETRQQVQKYIAVLNEKLIDDDGKSLCIEIVSSQADFYEVILFIVGNGIRVNIGEDLVQTGICKANVLAEEQAGKQEEVVEEEEEDEEEVERRMQELQRQMEELRLKKSKKK